MATDRYDELAGVDEAVIRREKNKARELRKTQWWRCKLDQGICHYCGRRCAREELTMDHVVPLARGGRSSKVNLVACCKACNSAKKSHLPSEWPGEWDGEWSAE